MPYHTRLPGAHVYVYLWQRNKLDWALRYSYSMHMYTSDNELNYIGRWGIPTVFLQRGVSPSATAMGTGDYAPPHDSTTTRVRPQHEYITTWWHDNTGQTPAVRASKRIRVGQAMHIEAVFIMNMNMNITSTALVDTTTLAAPHWRRQTRPQPQPNLVM